MLGLFFYPEHGSSTSLQNVGNKLPIIRANGGEEGHGKPKTMVKTKTIKMWYKMNLM
jgi:hypothetical protein